MTTTRISTDDPDLTPVLGKLEDEQRTRIVELLKGADDRLSAVRDQLAEQGGTWNTDGVVLETSISGQASVDFLLEDKNGKVSFALQLRPRNYFPTEEAMWQPGKPPLVMATDAWDVDGSVAVRFKTRVQGRPYTIQEQVVELEEQHHENAVAAVEGFAKLAEELAELALSREATPEAWRPEEPADVTPSFGADI